jgi:hypothetical protein
MRYFTDRTVLHAILAVALLPAAPVLAADPDTDALLLESESAPVATPDAGKDTQLYLEGMMGAAAQRYQADKRDLWRASLDFSHTARLGAGWRAVISDRVDRIYPADPGADATVNSLREAYVSWQPQSGKAVMELGRVNLRHGPAYGYNPTDFFRDGSLRTLTSADPFALRQNRLGVAVLRGQGLWSDGSISLAYAPKLAERPNPDGWNLDLGSTNNRDRGVMTLNTQMSQRVSTQLLAYAQQDMSPTLGASLTALLSDAAVGHIEWSRGSEPDLLSRALASPGPSDARNRFAGGITYTTLGKLSITAEYQYNGFALSQSDWAALGSTAPAIQMAYLREAQRRQELASREAYLVYVTQKSLFLKNLDLTAFVRVNAGDHSQLAWLELRHHWSRFDLAFQLQQHIGNAGSEYGLLPERTVTQILGRYYF